MCGIDFDLGSKIFLIKVITNIHLSCIEIISLENDVIVEIFWSISKIQKFLVYI
jgi:hypothetical protein